MDVALVGLVLTGVENHSLAVLRAAVEGCGRSTAVLPFRGWPEMSRVVAAIVREAPPLVGISIQSTESALPSVALAWQLRRAGFDGRIVAGGHFATLNAVPLLEKATGFDGVVRFAGEEALSRLARDGWRDEVLGSCPGLLFRDQAGAVRAGAPPLAVEPSASSRARGGEPLPRHLGFAAADLIDSRGCEARCAYCCIAAHSDAAERETGVRYGRRSLDEMVEEITSLHRTKAARVFTVMDDNLLPLDPAEAAAFLRALRRGLAGRRVPSLSLSLQLRADVVTEEVADELAAIGVTRAYVGIDGYSQPMLRSLGRKSDASAGVAALERLARRGILSVCNALLLGPTVAFETLCTEVDAIASIRHAAVHLLPIDVRAGTRYADRAERAGLVEGGFLFRRARCSDERTGLMATLLTALPTRLAERSVPIALYDLAYSLGIAGRLVPEADIAAHRQTWHSVVEAWNVDQVRVLRAGLVLAARGDARGIDDFLERERPVIRVHDRRLLRACDEALGGVERAVARVRGVAGRAHRRGQLLSAVAFSFGLSACSRSSALDVGEGVPLANLAMLDQAAAPDLAPPLNLTVVADLVDVFPFDPSTGVLVDDCGCDQLELVIDPAGCVVGVKNGDGGALDSTSVDCVLAVLKGHCYPSLAGQTVPVTEHCWIA